MNSMFYKMQMGFFWKSISFIFAAMVLLPIGLIAQRKWSTSSEISDDQFEQLKKENIQGDNMKQVVNLILILSLVFSSTGCMSMWGMGGMHGNMSNQQEQDSGQSQKSTFQNDELSLTLIVPVLFTGVSSNIELGIVYKSKDYEKNSPRLILSIEETGNSSSRTVEFDAEGVFPVEYNPKSSGFANISVGLLESESNEKLIFVQQDILDQRDSESIFSKTETYILGGIFMGAMMAVMLFTDMH